MRSDWRELAQAFAPAAAAEVEEKRLLRRVAVVLRAIGNSGHFRSSGAFRRIYGNVMRFNEKELHVDLERHAPAYGALVGAIRAYESIRAGPSGRVRRPSRGSSGPGCRRLCGSRHCSEVRPSERVSMGSTNVSRRRIRALGEIAATAISVQNLFDERFGKLAEPMDAQTCARALCEHHETIQRAKSAEGKRPWFDRIGGDRIYIRQRRIASRNTRLPPNDTCTAIAAGRSSGFRLI